MEIKDKPGLWISANAKARQCEQIDNFLSDELETKRLAWEAARLTFARAISEPSEGALQVQEAGASLKAATEIYMAALGEFNAFVIHGLLPKRLEDWKG